MKIRVCKRASIRNGRIEQGLGYGCRAAVEQGKALFRENLAVQRSRFMMASNSWAESSSSSVAAEARVWTASAKVAFSGSVNC